MDEETIERLVEYVHDQMCWAHEIAQQGKGLVLQHELTESDIKKILSN